MMEHSTLTFLDIFPPLVHHKKENQAYFHNPNIIGYGLQVVFTQGGCHAHHIAACIISLAVGTLVS